MVKTRKPVYVAIPVDVCKSEIDDFIPEIEMNSDKSNLEKAVNHICNVVNKSKRPVLVVDGLIKRFGLSESFENLIDKTKFPSTTLLMGKGAIDESNDCFIGTCLGNVSSDATQNIINNSDCIVTFGAVYADLNTGGFSLMPDDRFLVDIQADYCVVESVKYTNVWMADIVNELTIRLGQNKHSDIGDFGYVNNNKELSSRLTTSDIFEALQSFIKEDDLLFIETGIISFPCGLIKLPKNVSFHTQTLYGSIGWATPAMFGGAMADRSRRPILFTGEGSHQLTMQEVANMLHHNINPIIFVLNNSGYTVERALSDDPMDKFNDITTWIYTKMPELFNGSFCSAQVRTIEELEQALLMAEKEQKGKLCYIELFTDKMDVPDVVTQIINNIKKYSAESILCN